MPAIRRSTRLATKPTVNYSEDDHSSHICEKKEVVTSTKAEVSPLLPTVPAAPPSSPVDYATYKGNVHKLFDLRVKCIDQKVKPHLFVTTVEYLLQPDMLSKSSVHWFITWRASIECAIVNEPANTSFLKEAISVLNEHLEHGNHYKVSASEFTPVYDWILDFIEKRSIAKSAYYSSLLDYMILAAESAWADVSLEKKSRIRAEVMSWNERSDAEKYGVCTKATAFLAKYKMW